MTRIATTGQISYYDAMPISDWREERVSSQVADERMRHLFSKGASLIQTNHFRKRMVERKFSILDVLNVFIQGNIVKEGKWNDDACAWGYQVRTNKMFVVISFDRAATRMNLVTGGWIKKGRKL